MVFAEPRSRERRGKRRRQRYDERNVFESFGDRRRINGEPGQIVTGSDGNEWFVDAGFPHSIDKVTGGSVTPIPVPSATPAVFPAGIAAGSDGGIWFSDLFGGRIYRMNTSGTLTNTYALPTGTAPTTMIAGPDGALYFLETPPTNGVAVGRITTSGAFTLIPFPAGNPTASIALDITTGPDGAIWLPKRPATSSSAFNSGEAKPSQRNQSIG